MMNEWESIEILADLLDYTIKYVRSNVDFVIVYNKDKNPRSSQSMDSFADIVSKLGKDRICRFGFDNYRKLYFKNIVTYNNGQFNEDIKNNGFENVIRIL